MSFKEVKWKVFCKVGIKNKWGMALEIWLLSFEENENVEYETTSNNWNKWRI